MKHYLLFLLLYVFVGCNCNKPSNIKDKDYNDSITYLNTRYVVCINLKNDKPFCFKLYDNEKHSLIKGNATLITVCGEIPEGTLREDYNNPSDINGYLCEESYQYIDENIKIAFAMEKDSRNRLDLLIYDSKYKMFVDGNYTLYRTNNNISAWCR